ncbi:MAG TPA: protein kinase, partial [Ktedonobacteraceae bacterium]|nr:protein kinase [Ktedonobacteraceae bacterium]
MLCPRCGNEWDASRSSCSNCGFRVRAAAPTAAPASPADLSQRGGVSQGQTFTPGQQSGNGSMARQQRGNSPAVSTSNSQPAHGPVSGANWPIAKQNSGKLPTVKKQTDGLSASQLPNTPRPMSPPSSSLIPQRGANVHTSGPLSTNDVTMRPAFEKHSLRKVSPGRDAEAGQAFTQPPFSANNAAPSFGTTQQARPRPVTQPAPDDFQQDMPRPQAQPMTQRRPAPFDGGTNARGTSRPGGGAPTRQPTGPNAQVKSTGQPSNARPLTPGVQLRGNRYRLQELMERQDWLSGVFEAAWIGRDSQRGGQQVVICEVALPETASVMSQSILRTATMSLANVGRHPRIPALWDAFGDQGHSFFVFEPIEGESLLQRLRYTGRPLPEQEVIECCLQMTEVLDLLSQQSPQMVHGLIRPEHIIAGRNGSQYSLTNFSVVLAGGATQFVVGMERNRLSAYTAPEFVRGVVDVRTDMYSLIATAYHAVTGTVPSGISGSIPQAQRINHAISSEFDAILTKGLRAVANQRYQRPSELRQDLLALRSVSGSLVSPGNSPATNSSVSAANYAPAQPARSNGQAQFTQRAQAEFMPLPISMATDDPEGDRILLLPKPEDLPPMKQADDRLNAAFWLG